jgi:hypothetical protein
MKESLTLKTSSADSEKHESTAGFSYRSVLGAIIYVYVVAVLTSGLQSLSLPASRITLLRFTLIHSAA